MAVDSKRLPAVRFGLHPRETRTVAYQTQISLCALYHLLPASCTGLSRTEKFLHTSRHIFFPLLEEDAKDAKCFSKTCMVTVLAVQQLFLRLS